MAKQTFKSMSVAALLKLRNDVASALKKRAQSLKKELASLRADYAEVGRIAIYGRKRKRRVKRVQPKYRDPKSGQTWSGRGTPARWITAYEKKGSKRDQFLIAKGTKKARKKRRS
jgi:DNA-binding protein H-NS